MDNRRVDGYISGIQFSTGESLDIQRNDIVIFVGSNNAGKSQVLKSTVPISTLLDRISACDYQGSYINYRTLGHCWSVFIILISDFQKSHNTYSLFHKSVVLCENDSVW